MTPSKVRFVRVLVPLALVAGCAGTTGTADDPSSTAGTDTVAGESAWSSALPNEESLSAPSAAPTEISEGSERETTSPTTTAGSRTVPIRTTADITATPDGESTITAAGTATSGGGSASITTAGTAMSGFTSSISEIGPDLAQRMSSSYRDGCPVPLTDLRYLQLTYRGFDGADHTGELVVSARVADDVVAVFETLYDNDFSIRSMRLIDDFGGSDDASMAADNTAAFNCRAVTGGSSWSEHSYGEAIDINPRENPYLSGDLVLPSDGAEFVGRPDALGVIHPDDVVVRAFASIGWNWGGNWSDPVDLQHFSRSGR